MLTTKKALKREKEILVTMGETIGSQLGSLVAKANSARKMLTDAARTRRPARRATRAVKPTAKTARGAAAKTSNTALRTARKARRAATR